MPALRALTMDEWEMFETQFDKVFKVETSNRAIEQFSGITGFGNLQQIGETESMRYDEAVPTFAKTYKHTQYGLGYKISRLLLDDEKHSIVEGMSRHLGRSARIFPELIAASTLNRGFDATVTGPDGVCLFSTQHPLLKAGGVQSNTESTPSDISPESIQLALTAIRKTVDHTGKLMHLKPEMLIVPPELEFVAAEVLNIGSNMKPQTADNTINALKQRSGFGPFQDYMVYDYLTDPDAWFIRCSKKVISTRFFWREKFNTQQEIDFDSRTIKHAGWLRCSTGWDNYIGWWGSPGSGS